MVTRAARAEDEDGSAVRKCVRLMANSSATPLGDAARSVPLCSIPSNSRGKEVLLALDGLGEALEQQLQIPTAIHEVDLRGVNHQQVTGGVVEEKVFVGLRYLFEVDVTDGLFL